MKTSNNFILQTIMGLLLFIPFSCNKNHAQNNNKLRKQIFEEFEAYKKQLPIIVTGTNIKIINISYNDSTITYTAIIPPNDLKTLLPDSIADTDRNVARIISKIPDENIQLLIDAHLGLKYIYKNEGLSIIKEVSLSPTKLREIRNKVIIGKIRPYSLIEFLQMDIDQSKLPIQVDDLCWMTEAKIYNNIVQYTLKIKMDIDLLDKGFLEEVKQDIILDFKDNKSLLSYKKDFFEENIRFVYLYTNNRNRVIGRIVIKPSDIFN